MDNEPPFDAPPDVICGTDQRPNTLEEQNDNDPWNDGSNEQAKHRWRDTQIDTPYKIALMRCPANSSFSVEYSQGGIRGALGLSDQGCPQEIDMLRTCIVRRLFQ